jgi:enoyl-CoA hydratase
MNFIVTEQRESSIIIRLNNPAQRNALARHVLEELETSISALVNDSKSKAVIFTGTDDVFASGASIRELQDLTAETARAFALRGQHLFQQIARLPQKTIAAVNGYCIGGGLDLALSCNKRIAAPTAKFAHPGANLGIITGWGGTQRLPRLIGQARALDLIFTARLIEAEEALEIGLVDKICSDVVERALAQARSTTE